MTRMLSWSLAAGAPGSTALSEAPINCSNGCIKRRQRPVCGVDNVTYAHQCLAMCQGVAVQAQGACGNEDADLLDTSGDLPSVTIDVMTRFRSSGFKCVLVLKPQMRRSAIVPRLCGMVLTP
jgi:hypothetical protein